MASWQINNRIAILFKVIGIVKKVYRLSNIRRLKLLVDMLHGCRDKKCDQ
jgi:hypothetical protein